MKEREETQELCPLKEKGRGVGGRIKTIQDLACCSNCPNYEICEIK